MVSMEISKQKKHEDTDKFIVKFRENYYDISKFLHKHPGGSHVFKDLQNSDITKRFLKAHHSDAAIYLLREYQIFTTETKMKSQSKVNVKTEQNKSIELNKNYENNQISSDSNESMEHLIDWSRGVVSQIPNITKDYYEWVKKPLDRKLIMFDSWYLEMFTKCTWWIILTFWLPIIFKLAYDSFKDEFLSKNIFVIILLKLTLFVTGLILWSILEYFLHRFVFHIKVTPNSRPWVCILHFLFHGVHHKMPFDEMRLVFPILPAFIIFSILYIPFAFVIPQGRAMLTGVLFGYVYYDLTHYYIHFGRPNFKHLYSRQRSHYHHHFSNDNIIFGVTTSFWDRVFNTKGDLRKLRISMKLN